MTWRGSASPNPEPARDDETAQYAPTERYPAYGAATPQQRPAPPERQHPVDVKRLWTGGVATAVVAIGLTIVGFLIIQGLLQLTVLGIWPDGPVSTPSLGGYASIAALSALLATGLMHLLLLGVPRPRFFFAWVGALCTAIWVILPLTVPDSTGATTGAKAATAILNLVIGIAITAIIHSMAAYASRAANRLPPAPSYYDR
jgi:membrane-associated protease RseP (regulator of RpoE activity)